MFKAKCLSQNFVSITAAIFDEKMLYLDKTSVCSLLLSIRPLFEAVKFG